MTTNDNLRPGLDLGARVGCVLALRPDLTPADVGETIARTIGAELGTDPATVDDVAARARVAFAKAPRLDFLVMAAAFPPAWEAPGDDA